MFATLLNMWPILASSTDSVLRRADFINNVVVPVALVIMVVGAILGAVSGKKDK